MTTLEAALRQVCRDLAALEARFALIGGLAVSARTEPRFTRDADVAVAVADDAEAEALVLRLGRLGYHIGAVLEQEAVGRLATARLGPSGAVLEPMLGLLFASSGIEHEVVASAERLEILPRLIAPVATVGHLIALKVLSRDDENRPQDSVDLKALLRVASPSEMVRARQAVIQIADRGYHRGKDLLSAFDALVKP